VTPIACLMGPYNPVVVVVVSRWWISCYRAVEVVVVVTVVEVVVVIIVVVVLVLSRWIGCYRAVVVTVEVVQQYVPSLRDVYEASRNQAAPIPVLLISTVIITIIIIIIMNIIAGMIIITIIINIINITYPSRKLQLLLLYRSLWQFHLYQGPCSSLCHLFHHQTLGDESWLHRWDDYGK